MQGYNVAPGTSTSLVVKRHFSQKLPQPYNNCFKDLSTVDAYDSAIYREMIRSNETYRQRDCFLLCYQKQAIERCGCGDNSLLPLFNAKFCGTFEELYCVNTVYQDFKIDQDCLQLW